MTTTAPAAAGHNHHPKEVTVSPSGPAARVVDFTATHPGAYVVRFTDLDGEGWAEPVIGIAVTSDVVGLWPVVLDTEHESWPVTVRDYLRDRKGSIDWRMEAAG